MSMRADVLLAILMMGLASHLCRTGGFFLMRYVTITPRVEAWLGAIPVALIGAVLGPIAINGSLPEWAGLVTAIVTMRISGNDFISAVAAVIVVAIMRAAVV